MANEKQLEEQKFVNAYDNLFSAPESTWEELKSNYRGIQRTYHPDIYKGDDAEAAKEIIKQANIAAEELGLKHVTSNSGKTVVGDDAIKAREAYDKQLEALSNAKSEVFDFDDFITPGPEVSSTPTRIYYYPQPPASTYTAISDGSSFAANLSKRIGKRIGKKIFSTATKKIMKSAVGKALKAAGKQIVKKVATKLAVSAVGALATGGASIAIQAALEVASFAKKHGKKIMAGIAMGGKGLVKTGLAISSALIAAPAAAVSGSSMSLGASTVAVPAVIVVILLIMNANAYIVPISPGDLTVNTNNTTNASFECLKFVGPWPERALRTEIDAAELIFRFDKFGSDLCTAGDVVITYSTEDSRYGGSVSGDKMTIYQLGTGSLGNTFYTLAHELGHIYAGRNLSKLYAYAQNVYSIEREVCTYPYSNSSGESFAEMIALYIGGTNPPTGFATGSTGNRLIQCFPDGTFQSYMPRTWGYADTQIF